MSSEKPNTSPTPSEPLMRAVSTVPRMPRKVAVFLVHRVSLILQQANVVRNRLSSRRTVGVYYGEKNVDDWSSSKWARSLRTKNVLVMTAQIFLNLLRHGLLQLSDVALLVVDEVHHATKGHPYCRIFVEFYHKLPVKDRPRVFGMTATPVKKKFASSAQVFCVNAIATLEATLDATIVTVSHEDQTEVETLVPKPDEFILPYKVSNRGQELHDDKDEEDDMENRVFWKIANLNCHAASEHKLSEKKDVNTNKILEPGELKVVFKLCHKLGYMVAINFAKQLCYLNGIHPDLTIAEVLSNCTEADIEAAGIPEKVSKLLDTIFTEYMRHMQKQSVLATNGKPGNSFQCIVFTHERTSALSLGWLINSVFGDLKCKGLTAMSVVGAQNSDSHVRMSQSKLVEAINNFRRGEYGILVATNVVEEGLDIPACRTVIAFDLVSSPTAYVQGRGRARMKGARYIVFVEEDCSTCYETLYKVRQGAKVMNEVAKNGLLTDEDRRLNRQKFLNDISIDEKILWSKTTRARVSTSQAIYLLHRYFNMKVQQFQEGGELKPVYMVEPCGIGYLARVTLHPKFPIDSGSCLEPQESELLAKRCAALDAYSKLYQIGEVDAYLLPRRPVRSQRILRTRGRASDPGVRVVVQRSKEKTRRKVQSKASKKNKRVRRCHILHPRVLQVETENITDQEGEHPACKVSEGDEMVDSVTEQCKDSVPGAECDTGSQTLFLYSISIDCDMQHFQWYPSTQDEVFGILLREKIPEEDLRAIKCPYGGFLISLTYRGEVPWSPSMQSTAYKYVRCLQLCLHGRTPGSPLALEIQEKQYSLCTNPGFFLLPLVSSKDTSEVYDIDWFKIERLLCYGWKFGPLERNDVMEGNNMEHSLVCSYHENASRVYLSGKIHSTLRASSNPENLINSQFTSFNHYYSKKHGVNLDDTEQRMLCGNSVRETMSNLSTSVFMLAPETCRVVPLSPLACYITSLLPMWQTFLALRVCWRRNRIEENPVSFLSFARALQPNINNVSKEAADLSYERLEFLGDAVLKVIYSMVMFVKHPNDSEGILSDERDLEVSNQRLANLAMEMKLHNCVAFSGVSQKAKSWPWFWATHQNESIGISEKVLADCVEALIGAQYLHGGVELATVFMDKHMLLPGACDVLGIDKGSGGQMNTGRSVVVDVPPMGPGDARHESSFAEEVERIIGYTFQNRRHLVIALTHGSYENGLITSYQRYEYLGDAVVGFLLLSYFFYKYPDLSPGELTALRGPALSNDLFARVIVCRGIHKRFWHSCAPLRQEINKFEGLISTEEDDGDDVCKTMTVPKVLGDLLESIIGAIVVDNGMHLNGVQDIVLKLIEEELDRFANPDKFKHNPVSELVRLVQGRLNTLPVYKYLEENQDVEKICSIVVNEDEVGRGTGPTRRVAKRKASVMAMKSLLESLQKKEALQKEELEAMGSVRELVMYDFV